MTTLRLVPFLVLFAACQNMPIGYEPKPEDPLDGYSTLKEAGVSTEVDLGPKQEYLLSGYKELRDNHQKLEKDYKDLQDKHLAMQAKLSGEGESLTRERTLRTQAEAEVVSLQQKRRELEARILSLGIEKAKLEQTALLAKIAEMQRTLETVPGAAAVDAQASPMGGRQ